MLAYRSFIISGLGSQAKKKLKAQTEGVSDCQVRGKNEDKAYVKEDSYLR